MNDDLKKIVESRHERPFEVLGPQRKRSTNEGRQFVIRVFIPHALEVTVFIKHPSKKIVKMEQVDPDGLFCTDVVISEGSDRLDYVLRVTDAGKHQAVIRDPYNFTVADLAADEEKRFLRGRYDRLFERCGAHPETRNSVAGVRFGVWAPNAQRVSVVGSFNRWDGRYHPMQKISAVGLWELFIPGVSDGDFYKFEIRSQQGDVFLKTDPYAVCIEESPEAAAIVCDLAQAHQWQDSAWQNAARPRNIAVFQLSQPDKQSAPKRLTLGESELEKLARQGYTHLEIPTFIDVNSEIAAFFTPSPRIGSPQHIQALVDRCHSHGLGVIVDVIPLSLTKTPKNLIYFDGKPLYEGQEKQTAVDFHFAKNHPGVRNYLFSFVRFWQGNYHIDGFRLNSEYLDFYRDLIASCNQENDSVLWLVQDVDAPVTLNKDALEDLLQHRRLDNPHSILGPHRHPANKCATIRAILPKARRAYVYFPEQATVRYEMEQLGRTNLWQAIIPYAMAERDYRLQMLDTDGRHKD
ncbi:GlgB N-terminal domain-containing protein [Methylomarinum vadi]|uniref:GlgB N-terminal domain-containing protein n=1 Tax=Methylomarinum vadi TaxID=438855 RepID=UPI0004DFA804|nr:hypothetical protein [Methylomarinum vadi]